MQTIDTKQLARMKMTDPGGFLLVNVLSEQAFEKQRIPDSINIPVDGDDFVQNVRDRAGSKDEKIVVYCASEECNASPRAAKQLTDAGFTNVYDYEVGLEGWIREQGEQATEGQRASKQPQTTERATETKPASRGQRDKQEQAAKQGRSSNR
jgi:rhodanese-related sulfurtransferase